MTGLYFEDVEPGTLRRGGPYFVSRHDIVQFAREYDPQPFHLDEDAARQSVFAGLAGSSAHSFAIYIALTNKLQPSFRVLAALGFDEVRLPTALRPDSELDLESVVLDKRASASKCDRGIVRVQAHLRNQKRETVLQCTATLLLARRSAVHDVDANDRGSRPSSRIVEMAGDYSSPPLPYAGSRPSDCAASSHTGSSR